jgi:carbamoyl-phosphate synthase small subunit
MSTIREALLVLADGTTFEGEAIGAEPAGGVAAGEVVFNTALTGYQEIITDPSYAGQIITFTYPHIGNYGVTRLDDESRRPFARGVVVRDLARRRSNWRADGNLDSFLRTTNVPGIAGIDTRRLTRHIRDAGAMPGAFGTADETTIKAAATAEPGTDGIDLVRAVSCTDPYSVAFAGPHGRSPKRVVAYDLGIKTTILRHLSGIATVEVVPVDTPAADVLARQPDGVFLSNGPGDPSVVAGIPQTIDALLGEVPVFGICLGHQLLATALGASTYKLPFGHHGGNHPVRRLETGTVEITSQNHNYAVDDGSLSASVEVTHRNLNDGVVEGLRCLDAPAFSVQYHPEAGPGPHDAAYLFELFDELMDAASPNNDVTPNAKKGRG